MNENIVERNSNIELLRIVLISMVLILHFNLSEEFNGGGAFDFVKDLPIDNFILHFFESLCIGAVNCFMIISGYFLAYNRKIKFSKIFDLISIVIFYRVFSYILSVFVLKNQSFSLSAFVWQFIPANYFMIFYCISYFFSPFIVKIFDSTTRNQQIIFVSSLLAIFVLWATFVDFVSDFTGRIGFSTALSPISTIGNAEGYSIVQFFVALICGIFLRRNEFKVKGIIILIIYFGSSLFMTFFVERFPSFYNYCSIFTLINAVCVFLLFKKLNFQNKVVNNLSKSVFAIFCFHNVFLPFVRNCIVKNLGGGVQNNSNLLNYCCFNVLNLSDNRCFNSISFWENKICSVRKITKY